MLIITKLSKYFLKKSLNRQNLDEDLLDKLNDDCIDSLEQLLLDNLPKTLRHYCQKG